MIRLRRSKSRVSELRREVLGETHPDTLQAMHDLAITGIAVVGATMPLD
jgi:hypothetical protein